MKSEIEQTIYALHEKFNRLAETNGYDSIDVHEFIKWIEHKIKEEFDRS